MRPRTRLQWARLGTWLYWRGRAAGDRGDCEWEARWQALFELYCRAWSRV